MSVSLASTRKSVVYVYVSQAAAALFPLLVAPFIVRSMGLENFGVYAVLLMCVQGAAAISEYSFDAFGPRMLASIESERGGDVYWGVLSNKLTLFPAAILAAAVAALMLSGPHFDLIAVLAVCAHVVGVAIQAPWYLIATGQTGVLAASTLVGRVFALVAIGAQIYWSVASPPLLLLATSVGILMGGCVALVMNGAISECKRIPTPKVDLLPRGAKAFVGVLGAFLQNFIGQAVAWWSGGAVGAGLYAAVDRLARAVSAGLKPLFSVAYPRLVKLHRDSPAVAWRFIDRAALVWFGISVILVCVAFILSGRVLALFYGEGMEAHRVVLLIIVGWLCVGVLNNIYGIQGILASGMDSVFARAMWLGIGFSLVAAFSLTGSLKGALLAAVAVLIGEIAILIYYLLSIAISRRACELDHEE